jgi:hypothetical protein
MDTPPPILPNDPLSGPPVPPGEGMLWVKAALRFFQTDVIRWLGITAAFLLMVQLVTIIPGGLGMIIVFLLKPVLTVGFLAAAWHQERGERPQLTHLLYGFRSNWKALVPLGIVYMLGVVVALTMATAVSGVALDQFVVNPDTKLTPDQKAKLMSAMLWTILFMLPVTLALWFAPALIVFDDLPFSTALKRSLRACTRSLPAIIIYAIVLFGLATGLSLIVAIVQVVSPAIANVLIFMLVLPLTAIVFIADYVSYRRVFHPQQPLRIP